jgi:hypothetical protein
MPSGARRWVIAMQELAVLEGSTKRKVRPIVDGEMVPPVPAVLVRALESMWEQAVRQGQKIGPGGLGPLEKKLREDILRLGGLMLGEALPLALGTGYNHSRLPCSCGKKAKYINDRPKTITTLLSDIRLLRAYYYCCDCGAGQVPMDEVLDIEGSTFSPGAREAICLLDAQRSFETGRDLLERLSGVRMHEEEGRLLAHEKGRELERQTQEELRNVWQPKKPVPREIAQTPQRLYFSPDGTTVLTQEEKWKEAKMGTVFSTDIPDKGQDPQRLHTRYAATMGNAEDLGKRLYVEALKLGLAEQTQVVVVADGAHWIWNWSENSLPKNRVEIIDFYHASEKLWEVSRSAFGEDNPEGKGWARRWRDKLYKGKVGACLAALRRLKPRTQEGREAVRKTIGYFQTNRKRMHYNEFRKAGYFIGSGVTESGCKHLVGQRLKQAGMRWKVAGAQAMLQLRAAYLNGRWDSLWRN